MFSGRQVQKLKPAFNRYLLHEAYREQAAHTRIAANLLASGLAEMLRPAALQSPLADERNLAVEPTPDNCWSARQGRCPGAPRPCTPLARRVACQARYKAARMAGFCAERQIAQPRDGSNT